MELSLTLTSNPSTSSLPALLAHCSSKLCEFQPRKKKKNISFSFFAAPRISLRSVKASAERTGDTIDDRREPQAAGFTTPAAMPMEVTTTTFNRGFNDAAAADFPVWEKIGAVVRLSYGIGIYGAMAVAGSFICSITGIDSLGGFHLSLDAILEGLGYAAPPIMALLFILDDEVVKLSPYARAIRDVEDEELWSFFYGMSPWQFILMVAASSVGEELFYRAAVQMTNDNSKMTSKFAKLDKFEGQDFRRWQKKMHFLLTTLKVVYVLSTPMPLYLETETLEQTRKRLKWENDDYICRGHILNGMSDSLFDIYQNVESAKELWDSLESKYMAKDASSNKFLVSNFFNYKMVDSRPVMEQYNELLRILGQFTQHDLKMDESIAVSSIIDKLPASWKDFKHTLKHKKEELTLVQLGSHFMIEESLRAQENEKANDKNMAGPSSVNMVEESGTGNQNYKGKGKKRKFQGNKNKGPNKQTKLSCWKCGKPGHLKRDCRVFKEKNKAGPGGSNDPEKQQG